MGLVNRVVPAADLMPAARELAKRIMRHSSLAAAGILSAVTRGIIASIGEGLLMESEQFARLVPSHDLSEGLDAWKARRKLVYAGR